MKKLKFLSMMLMLMVGLVSFTACGDDDDDISVPGFDSNGNPSIVGRWSFDSNKVSGWSALFPTKTIKETLSFSANGTGTVTGTTTEEGSKPSDLNATFDYILTWKDNVGTLTIDNMKGLTGLLESGTYRLNVSASGDRLSPTVLRLDGIEYKK